MKSYNQREPLRRQEYSREEIIVDDFGQQWVFEDEQFKLVRGVIVTLSGKTLDPETTGVSKTDAEPYSDANQEEA